MTDLSAAPHVDPQGARGLAGLAEADAGQAESPLESDGWTPRGAPGR